MQEGRPRVKPSRCMGSLHAVWRDRPYRSNHGCVSRCKGSHADSRHAARKARSTRYQLRPPIAYPDAGAWRSAECPAFPWENRFPRRGKAQAAEVTNENRNLPKFPLPRECREPRLHSHLLSFSGSEACHERCGDSTRDRYYTNCIFCQGAISTGTANHFSNCRQARRRPERISHACLEPRPRHAQKSTLTGSPMRAGRPRSRPANAQYVPGYWPPSISRFWPVM
jgi:hypothetical protein